MRTKANCRCCRCLTILQAFPATIWFLWFDPHDIELVFCFCGSVLWSASLERREILRRVSGIVKSFILLHYISAVIWSVYSYWYGWGNLKPGWAEIIIFFFFFFNFNFNLDCLFHPPRRSTPLAKQSTSAPAYHFDLPSTCRCDLYTLCLNSSVP